MVPGVEKALVLSETYDKRPGFAYNGEGLRNGHCGVTIKRVTSANQGEIKCNLGVDGEEIDGSVGLTVACNYITDTCYIYTCSNIYCFISAAHQTRAGNLEQKSARPSQHQREIHGKVQLAQRNARRQTSVVPGR